MLRWARGFGIGLVFLLVVLLCGACQTPRRAIPAGGSADLRAGEGLLVLPIESDQSEWVFEILRGGDDQVAGVLQAPHGRSVAVFPLPEGRYCLKPGRRPGICLLVRESTSSYGGTLWRRDGNLGFTYDPSVDRAEFEGTFPEVAQGYRFVAPSGFQDLGVSCSDQVPDAKATTSSSALPMSVTRSIIEGSLQKSAIRKVIQHKRDVFKQCYEQALASVSTLLGKVVVKFVIDGSGAVKGAKITSDAVGAPEMAECIRTTICRLQFPPPKGRGGVIVIYPFIFRAIW